ncbi:MAG: hypothetical protein NTX31_14170, partial [Burkholderiales bacterium]|nr:hypothetical protein [Burkholderiales bacterium]
SRTAQTGHRLEQCATPALQFAQRNSCTLRNRSRSTGITGHDRRNTQDSSLIRKFTQIGSKFDQLIANADKLPNTWTTVYQIALLADDSITALMEKGVINPRLSGSNVKEVLGLSQTKATVVAAAATEVVPNGTEGGICFKARLPSCPNAAVREQLKRILKDLKAINFEVEESSTLQEFLVDEPMALAA